MNLKHIFILTGILIASTLSAQTDYFWVGGQGNWANLNNWITSSGLPPEEVPDANDNVIFNDNSFDQDNDTVFIFTKNPECKNMIWENLKYNVVLAGGADSTSLSVYGSLTFEPKVYNDYRGKINFQAGTNGNTITCSGNRFFADIYFDGEGEWILQDTLMTWDTTDWQARFADPTMENPPPDPFIYLQKGTLRTNGQVIIAEGFVSSKENLRELDMESSEFYIIGPWVVNATGLDLKSANSLITMRGTMSNFNGFNLIYNNVIKMPDETGNAGVIETIDLRSTFNVVEYKGGGTMQASTTPGQLGHFTVDTVTMLWGPAPNAISGFVDSINYGRFDGPGFLNVNESYIKKFDLNVGGKLDGKENDIDSIFFKDIYSFGPAAQGMLTGKNYVDYLYFQTLGVLSSYQGSNNTVIDAVYAADGFLGGKNTITNLYLGSGFWYQFSIDSLDNAGNTTGTNVQTILQSIQVIGDCEGGLTWLTSTKKTIQAYMVVPAGGLNTDYLAVRDINNAGGTVMVLDGIDMGNNNGFSITEITNRDLYWVGGQGDWSDVNHWSLSSGGPGGECPPTIRDDIFFEDAGLGLHDTVFVDVKYGKCHDMTWTVTDSAYISSPINYDYAPDFLIPVDTTNLRIWGSLQYTDPMQSAFTGNYFFESQYDTNTSGVVVPQTIEFAGKPSYKQITFYGDNGAWKLLDSIINDNDTIFLKMGNLNTNNQLVRCYNFNSMDTLRRTLSLGKSTFIVRQKASDAWFVNHLHLDFNSGTSTIKAMGDEFLMPGEPPNQCHVRSMNADSMVYHNVEFHSLQALLKSEGYCIYNLVDYMNPAPLGQLVGLSVIDTLTFHEGAANCAIKNSDTINVLMAYGLNDTILGGQHIVNEANFFNEGFVFGYNRIGQLNFYKKGTMILQNDVDSAIFYSDGYIRGNNTFDTLVFTPGNKYFLQHDGTQTVTTNWSVAGTCTSPIRIQSDSIGTQAMISAEYQNVEIEYASFRDLYAVDNGGPYTAKHSVDMGNNTNWDFTQVDDDLYYWIQGTGNWSDAQHWSLSSGGPPLDCLPRELNTVVFDDNSFSSPNDVVTIDIPNASCLSMWWKQTPGSGLYPTFTGEDTTNLFIYGSLLLNDSMDYDYRGLIFFDEISGDKKGLGTDTITSKGKVILDDIRFQGINGEWILADSLTLLVQDPTTYRTIYLEHGVFDTRGHKVFCGSLESEYNNPRGLIIKNSTINVTNPYQYGWIVDGDNLTLEAEKSTIINNGIFSFVKSYDGDTLKYNDVIMAAPLDSLVNSNNIVEYNVVHIDGAANWFGGNFIADSVIFKGVSSGMYLTSRTNVVILDTSNCKISDNHHVNKGIVNFIGTVIGHNDFDYCIFNSDGIFRGENTFDTLILTPGKGNTFYFEEEKSQIIYDSLFLRGNQCQNITIKSLNLSKTAYLKKDDGIVQCDFLNIYNVGTEGTTTFYAGKNSTPLPNPNIPPPGWIFDDSQGYIYGFPDTTVYFCYGDVYDIPTVNFNGDSKTQYVWRDMSGNVIYTGPVLSITEPGIFSLEALYTDECSYIDTITIESVDPPVVTLDPGPYCEGDIINVEVTPATDEYTYQWSNGSTEENLEAQLSLNGILSVQATEKVYGCKSADTTTMQVEPVPKPDDNLPPDQTLLFGETITLDAGEGDTYSWSADNPLITIPDPTQRYITVGGTPDPGVTYTVEVNLGICSGTGDVKLTEYPRCKCDVPNAFSPNGDGTNDVLYVRGSGLHDLTFMVYDRYGKLVFKTDNLDNGWDGNINGIKQAKEVYTFYLKGVCEDGGVIEKKGNITLIR